MMNSFFDERPNIKFEGCETSNPMAFRYYDAKEEILGRTMEDHLRFAVCYWHSFCWPGNDPFGGQTFERPWFSDMTGDDQMQLAKLKADIAFEMFSILTVPFYCFHDFDIRPEGQNFSETTRNLEE